MSNAEAEVKAWVKGKKWRRGWDAKKKRFVKITVESFDCVDPAKVQNVMVQRDMAKDVSWDNSAKQYRALYMELTQ